MFTTEFQQIDFTLSSSLFEVFVLIGSFLKEKKETFSSTLL